MANEQWGLFSVSYLLWHRPTVHDGQIRGPVTLAPVTEHLAVELSLPIFETLGFRSWEIEHPTFSMWGKCSNQLHHRCDRSKLKYVCSFICISYISSYPYWPNMVYGWGSQSFSRYKSPNCIMKLVGMTPDRGTCRIN